MCVHAHTYIQWHKHEDQKQPGGVVSLSLPLPLFPSPALPFSPSLPLSSSLLLSPLPIMWVPETKLRSLGLATVALPCCATLL